MIETLVLNARIEAMSGGVIFCTVRLTNLGEAKTHTDQESLNGLRLSEALVYAGKARRNAVLVVSEGAFTQRHLESGHVFRPERLRVSESRHARGPVLKLGNRLLIHTGNVSKEVERGILVAGPSHNWFHWVVEILPTIFRSVNSNENWADWPLLTRGEPLAYQNHRTLLSAVAPNAETLEVPTQSFFLAKEIVIPVPTSNPGSTDFGLLRSTERRNSSWIDSKNFQAYRALLKKKFATPARSSSNHRIFLLRGSRENRQYNEEDVLKVAENFGFVGINPAEYTLENLWALLSEAQFVIGPQGAAWANTIVCPEGSFGLQWSAQRLRGQQFNNLAKEVGMNLSTFVCDGLYDGNYKVDLTVFNELLSELISRSGPGRSHFSEAKPERLAK